VGGLYRETMLIPVIPAYLFFFKIVMPILISCSANNSLVMTKVMKKTKVLIKILIKTKSVVLLHFFYKY